MARRKKTAMSQLLVPRMHTIRLLERAAKQVKRAIEIASANGLRLDCMNLADRCIDGAVKNIDDEVKTLLVKGTLP